MILGAIIDASSALMIAPIFDLMMTDQGSRSEYSNLTRQVLKYIESTGLPATTSIVLLIFLFIYCFRSLLAVIAGWYDAKIRAKLTKIMTMDLFASVVNADWPFFLKHNQGQFINSITRETVNLAAAVAALVNCIVALIQILTFGIICLLVSWQLTSICLGIAFISGIPLLLLSRVNYKWGQETVVSAGESNSITQESFSLAKVIQAYAMEQNCINALEKQQVIQEKLYVKYITLTKVMQEFYYPLGLISVITGYYFSTYFNIPFAELTIVLYCLWKCVPYLTTLIKSNGQLGQFLPSFENIQNLHNLATSNTIAVEGRDFKDFRGSLKLEKIRYKYEAANSYALDSINLSIKKGDFIAFVGSSGSGKTTLVDVIMGFLNPSSGLIKIDGVELKDYKIRSFRNKIGYVPQQSVLFNTSIKQNLLWANNFATEDDINDACIKANAKEFIDKLPEGLNTVVGDRGVRLSGGQIQRIAIARAIIRKPQILIMDEATSSLDSESEIKIQKAIENIAQSTTMIVIAHRLSTVKNADVIFLLNGGKVIETGNYPTLMQMENGEFKKMWNRQVE